MTSSTAPETTTTCIDTTNKANEREDQLLQVVIVCGAFVVGLTVGIVLNCAFRKLCRCGMAKKPITTADNWDKNREECGSGDVTVTNQDECTRTSSHPQHPNSSSKKRGKTPEVGEHKGISRGESRKKTHSGQMIPIDADF